MSAVASTPFPPVEVGWLKTADSPERWERPGLGAIEARGPSLWAVLPTCGHDYFALDMAAAKRQSEERGGFCYQCWRTSLKPEDG
jgi:hypothetical protein